MIEKQLTKPAWKKKTLEWTSSHITHRKEVSLCLDPKLKYIQEVY